jgi:hypothetical protein
MPIVHSIVNIDLRQYIYLNAHNSHITPYDPRVRRMTESW